MSLGCGVSETTTPGAPAQASAEEKRVTWAELYFDLVFVYAITQVSGLLHHDHSWAGVGKAVLALLPLVTHMPALAALSLVAAAVAALNITEYEPVRRRGGL